jgi:hypothetical protein
MDPQATWEQLQEAYGNADWETARELAQALLAWLDRGGFPPTTEAGDSAGLNERRARVREFCRDAIRRGANS